MCNWRLTLSQFFQVKLFAVSLIVSMWFGASFLHADVRVLLDVSKSMAENDPENIRRDALQLLIDSIPNGERAGVWTFGQYVNLLIPHQNVNSAWRSEATTKINNLGAPAVRTNMGRALEDAAYDFNFSSYDGPSHVVLITDGKVDIAPNDKVNRVERERILSQLVPLYVRANARIHTVAMSDYADHALLKQLSEQTGGQYQRIKKAQSLTKVLVGLSSEISPSNQLAIKSKSFDVDAGIRELTVLMYHSEGAVSLIGPDGKQTSAVSPAQQRWRVGSGFTQVSLSSPMQGRWQVDGDLENHSSIRVISDITLQWTSPETSSVAKGSLVSIEAMLVDPQGESIAEDLGQIIQATLRVDGVLVPVRIQEDKVVARIAPQAAASSLSVELNIDGGTFNRLVNRQLHYIEPYISEVLMAEQGYEWRLYPNRFMGNVEDIEAIARFERDGVKIEGEFELQDGGYWLWRLPYDVEPGKYQVSLNGSLMQGDSIMLLSPEMVELSIPPSSNSGLPMTPTMLDSTVDETTTSSGEFAKDPMPEFTELQADIVIEQPTVQDEWIDDTAGIEPESNPDTSPGMEIGTYFLLSTPGLLVLVIAYLFYRRLEQKAKVSSSEDELILGGDEFSGLDDIDALGADSDLDISGLDDPFLDEDGPMPNAPVIDDVIDEDLPTRENAEAPTLAEEDMLDSEAPVVVPEAEVDTVEDPEEELFDISSIDDDLADLDLALDGDDPFADADVDIDER